MSQDWINSGVEVAEIVPNIIGSDTVHLCFVDHVTPKMVVLDNGHRYWRDTLCPVGKTDGYSRPMELCRPDDERVLTLRAANIATRALAIVYKTSRKKRLSTTEEILALLADSERVLRGARAAIINDLPWGSSKKTTES